MQFLQMKNKDLSKDVIKLKKIEKRTEKDESNISEIIKQSKIK